MTITNIYTPKRDNGNGSTSQFTYSFKTFDSTELKVSLASAANVLTLQVLDTDYSVAINATTEGGTVKFLLAIPPATDDVLIERVVPLTQVTEFPEVGQLAEPQLANPPDKLAMQTQQLNAEIGRSLKLSVADDTNLSNFNTELTGITSNAFLSFNSTGTGLTTTGLADITGSGIAIPVTSGISVFTGSSTFIARELAGIGNVIITNSTGVSGNPTVNTSNIDTAITARVTLANLASTSNGGINRWVSTNSC